MLLVLMEFINSLFDCEYDLVLEDKTLNIAEYPPKDGKNGEVLYPSKLD